MVAELGFDWRVGVFGVGECAGGEREGCLLEWSDHASTSHPAQVSLQTKKVLLHMNIQEG